MKWSSRDFNKLIGPPDQQWTDRSCPETTHRANSHRSCQSQSMCKGKIGAFFWRQFRNHVDFSDSPITWKTGASLSFYIIFPIDLIQKLPEMAKFSWHHSSATSRTARGSTEQRLRQQKELTTCKDDGCHQQTHRGFTHLGRDLYHGFSHPFMASHGKSLGMVYETGSQPHPVDSIGNSYVLSINQ